MLLGMPISAACSCCFVCRDNQTSSLIMARWSLQAQQPAMIVPHEVATRIALAPVLVVAPARGAWWLVSHCCTCMAQQNQCWVVHKGLPAGSQRALWQARAWEEKPLAHCHDGSQPLPRQSLSSAKCQWPIPLSAFVQVPPGFLAGALHSHEQPVPDRPPDTAVL